VALLERLRRDGFAGASVFHGIAGFGARSVLHTSQLLRLSEDLPVVIEVVDTEQKIQELIPILDDMVDEGLVTLEKVRVLKYAGGSRPIDSQK
jgi:PII-like signaling protein